jgi:predicted amidohydrolase YtcJ
VVVERANAQRYGDPSAEELPSRVEALRMYTINGAWMSFDEADRGSLEPNKLADLAVLDRDYMTIPVEDVGNIQSLLTVVGGKVVYAATLYEQVGANK